MKFMKGKPVSDRYLLEGTIVALDHVLTGTPIFASPQQAQQHQQQINSANYSGPKALYQPIARTLRLHPRHQDDEETDDNTE